MPEPYNYIVPRPDIGQEFIQGIQLSNALQQMRQQQLYNADLQQARQANDPQAFLKLALKYPEQGAKLKSAWEMMDADQKKAELNATQQIWYAVNSQRPDIALNVIDQQATAMKNSGKDPQKLLALRQAIERDPQRAGQSLSMLLATIAPKDFAETFTKLNPQADSQFSKVNPSDYTAESVKKFQQAGGKDFSILEPRVSPNKQAEIAVDMFKFNNLSKDQALQAFLKQQGIDVDKFNAGLNAAKTYYETGTTAAPNGAAPSGTPAIAPIDTTRPIINNPDGSFSTERTITIESNGKHILIPTIVNGKQLTQDQAIAEWKAGNNKDVGQYNSAEEAERAAVARSQQIGRVRGTPADFPRETSNTATPLSELKINGKLSQEQRDILQRELTNEQNLLSNAADEKQKSLHKNNIEMITQELRGQAGVGTSKLVDGIAAPQLGKGGLINSPNIPPKQRVKMLEEQPQQQLAATQSLENTSRMLNMTDELFKHPGLSSIVGRVGQYKVLDVTDETRNARALQETLTKQEAVRALQAMRDASKTGGAVGNVTEKEWPILERSVAALDNAQSPDAYKAALVNFKKQLQASQKKIREAYESQYGKLDFKPAEYVTQAEFAKKNERQTLGGTSGTARARSVLEQADAIIGR